MSLQTVLDSLLCAKAFADPVGAAGQSGCKEIFWDAFEFPNL